MNVLILTADAGGGHLSVARALAAGFAEVGGSDCQVSIVDYLANYAPFPFSHASDIYTFLMRYPWLWSMFYSSTNRRFSRDVPAPAVWLALEAGMSRLLREYAPDVVVATHPLGAPALNGLLYRRRRSLPFYTVVTDYGRLHIWWAYPFGELWFAPCPDTARNLERMGIPGERIVVSGYPVHPRFARLARPQAELRVALGLEPERFTVLLVGGAEGVGPIEETVEALASAPAPWQLDVVTGRNAALRERLEARADDWAIPVRVDGLVDDMPSRMHAADLLVSKGGGSTLSEALVCGLPALLIGVLPGQEEENAALFEEKGLARWLSSPAEIHQALLELAAPGSPALATMRACVRQAAPPAASIEVARHVLGRGNMTTTVPMFPFIGLHQLQGRATRLRATMRRRVIR